jgi:hypothetical protein
MFVSTSVQESADKEALCFQALYGEDMHFPPDPCSDSTFDAIFQYPAGVMYVLKGEGDTV